MQLKDGHYITKAGSHIWLSRNGGKAEAEFDWVEEPHACCDCQVDAYPHDEMLTWHCDFCGGGGAELFPVGPNARNERRSDRSVRSIDLLADKQ